VATEFYEGLSQVWAGKLQSFQSASLREASTSPTGLYWPTNWKLATCWEILVSGKAVPPKRQMSTIDICARPLALAKAITVGGVELLLAASH